VAQYDINFREYWRILKKRKFIVILTAILLGTFSTLFAFFQAPLPLFTSTCSIEFEREATPDVLARTLSSWSGVDDIETQITIISGHSVIEEVAKVMGLIPRSSTENNIQEAKRITIIENLQSKVKVEREEYTEILNIMVTDLSPSFAQRMANTIATTYKKMHAEQQSKRTDDALNYIDEQLQKMRGNLKNAEERFNSFSQKNQLISIDLQSENLLLRSKEIRDELRKQNEITNELEALHERVKKFLENPTESGNNFYSANADRQYQSTNDIVVGLLLKKETLLENFTEQHPDVIANGQKIVENVQKMILILSLQINIKTKRTVDLNEELDALDYKTNVLMSNKLEYDRLKREVESFREMTALLEQKNYEAQITKADKPEEVVIIKRAQLPTSRTNPPRTEATGAMGLIIGLVLGLVLAFIVETFDTSLGAIEDVEETLGAKVLGVIPHTDGKDILESLRDRYPEGMDDTTLRKVVNLVSHFAPKTMISEGFRALRTNIQFREGEDRIKTLAIASSTQQEGKTLISVNLSLSLAQAGLKTLVIGADLRKPMLSKVFGLEITPGLTDIVLGNYPWRDTVKTVTDIIMGRMTMDEVMMTPGLDNLHIITCGAIPPNPAELIESRRFLDFMEDAKKEYDIIVFDSTPILSTADAAILGSKVDGILLVYRVGSVSRGLLKRSASQLEQVKGNIIGVVLNGMKPEISPDFQDFKNYRYYSTYGTEDEDRSGHWLWKIFSFSRRAKDSGSSFEGVSRESLSAQGGGVKSKYKTSGALKWFLLLIALVLLAGGLLWQNGIIDPLDFIFPKEPVSKDPVQPVKVKKSVNVQEKIMPAAVPEEQSGEQVSAPPSETIQENITSENDTTEEAELDTSASEIARAPEYEEGSFPYSIYLGSYQSFKRAEKALSIYEKKGFLPYIVKVNIRGKGIWYRIYADHFTEKEDAQELINRNKIAEAEIKKIIYANLIGTYTSQDELNAKIQSLKSSGYSPYIIEDPSSVFRLFAGAFFTERGAEDLSAELESSNFISEIVKR